MDHKVFQHCFVRKGIHFLWSLESDALDGCARMGRETWGVEGKQSLLSVTGKMKRKLSESIASITSAVSSAWALSLLWCVFLNHSQSLCPLMAWILCSKLDLPPLFGFYKSWGSKIVKSTRSSEWNAHQWLPWCICQQCIMGKDKWGLGLIFYI